MQTNSRRKGIGWSTVILFSLAVCFGVLLTTVVTSAAPVNAQYRMSDKVKMLAHSGESEKVNVIVRYNGMPDQLEAKRVAGYGGEVYRSYGQLPLWAIRIPAKALGDLANGKEIKFITLDKQVEANSMEAKQTARLPASNASGHIPVDPRLTIAVLDSGVSDAHPDLNVVGRVDIVPVNGACGGSVRDEFNSNSFDGNDGDRSWKEGWVEYDVAGAGPGSGNVTVRYGELLLDDRPNTGTQPSAARAVDLSLANTATFSFDYRNGPGVDKEEDRIAFDISRDGGASFTTLEVFEINDAQGTASGARSYDITPYISSNTVIRFRVYDLYGGPSEYFAIDNVEIRTDAAAGACNLSDPFGHGTHVAGVIAGDGTLSGGSYSGVAPGASIYSVRVLDHEGKGTTSGMIAGLDWVLQNA